MILKKINTANFINKTLNFNLMKKTNFCIISFLFGVFYNNYSQSYDWTKGIGGIGSEYSYGTTNDNSGNVYVCGGFSGTVDFDPNAGVQNRSSNGNYDIFILKLDNSGNFVWVYTVGGINGDLAQDIHFGYDHNLYITGRFSENFNFNTNGSSIHTSNGAVDIFLLKIDTAGNYINSISLGGSLVDGGRSLCTDSFANVYLTGTFQSSVDFDPGIGVLTKTEFGSGDIFLIKLDSALNLVFVDQIGGSGSDMVYSIDCSPNGSSYITGNFEATADFDPGPGVFNLTTSNQDVFVAKFNSYGSLNWAKKIGGIGTAVGLAIALGTSDNLFVGGAFSLTCNFNPNGTYNLTSSGGTDGYVVKLDTNGTFETAFKIGSTDADAIHNINTDIYGNLYITGYFMLTSNFNPNGNIFNLSSFSASSYDYFLVKYNNIGVLEWGVALGSTGYEYGYDITINSQLDVFSTGHYTNIVDFNPTSSVDNLPYFGSSDIFIQKFGQCNLFTPYYSIVNNDSICLGDSCLLISNYPNAINQWSDGSTDDTLIVTSDGFYSLLISNSANCQIQTDSIKITVFEPILVSFELPQNRYCFNETSVLLSNGVPLGGTYSGIAVSGSNFNPSMAGLGAHIITYTYIDANGCSNYVTDTITVIECLSIDIYKNSSVSIYPNPAKNLVTVSIPAELVNSNYSLIDPAGRTVMTGVLKNLNNSLDISALAKGLYILQVGEQRLSLKLIKE
jgi:hypothetical protein